MTTKSSKRPQEIFGWTKDAFTKDPHVVLAEYILIFIMLIVVSLLAQHRIKVWQLKYFPEVGATILIGMIISGIIRLSGANTSNSYNGVGMLGFSSPVFFIGLLPPIIFNSGYQLKRRLFFANLGAILALAVLGTTISALFIGTGLYYLGGQGYSKAMTLMECLSFGSLISATDPVSTLAVFSDLHVDPTLFYLVFGESVLNDAIGIVLFKTTSKYIGLDIGPEDTIIAIIDFCICFIGSCIIGYTFGLFAAWLFKIVDFQNNKLVTVSVFVSLVYIPFLLSETLQLSGVVTILFSAIASRRYINKNIPNDAKVLASFVFELMAYLSETTVFLSLGMSVIDKEAASSFNFGFISWSLLLCLLGRALHVYPLLGLINFGRVTYSKYHNETPDVIPTNTQHMIFFSGLRGAVAYACANVFADENDNRSLIQTTTMVIIMFTIFVKGGGTVIALTTLQIPMDVDLRTSLQHLRSNSFQLLRMERRYILPLVVRESLSSSHADTGSPSPRSCGSNTPNGSTFDKNQLKIESHFSSSDDEDDDYESQDIQDLRAVFVADSDGDVEADLDATNSTVEMSSHLDTRHHPDNLRIRATMTKRDPISRRLSSSSAAYTTRYTPSGSYSNLYNFGRAGRK